MTKTHSLTTLRYEMMSKLFSPMYSNVFGAT